MTNARSRPTGIVTVILPAKNEAAAIGSTLRSIPNSTLAAMGLDTEVVVLDGQSTDATVQIARRWGARVVTDREPGKAMALRHARHLFRGDWAVMLDADGTYTPDSIPRLLAPLLDGQADVVLGHRRRLPGSMSTLHFMGNKALSVFATFLFARTCRDVCTGMWAFRMDVLRSFPLRSQRFGLEAELFARTARHGVRLSHVRVDYLPRRGLGKLEMGRDGLRIIRRLMRSRFDALNDPQPREPGVAERRPASEREVPV